MATKQKQQASDKRGEKLYESPEALAEQISKTEEFVKNNSVLVYGGLGVLVLIIMGLIAFRFYKDGQNQEGLTSMFQAQFYYEQDSLDYALNGDGNYFGFLEIIDFYGGTQAANLSHFYAGSIYLQKGDYNEAIDHLTDFSSSDLLVQARAYSLIGDSYMELSDYEKAGSYYDKAANYKPNQFFSPGYLMKAGLAYELAGDNAAAKKRYDQILEEFPSSNQDANAKREAQRLAAMMN